MAACALLTLAVGACSAGGSDRGTLSHGKKIVRTDGVVQEPQSAALVLSAGRSSAHYGITAPPPARYTFDVSVTAPTSVNVAVNIRTGYGTTLTILDSSHDLDWCKRRASQDICFLPLDSFMLSR